MAYRRLTCYFLSGTGNSFRAARWLADDVQARGIPSARCHDPETEQKDMQ